MRSYLHPTALFLAAALLSGGCVTPSARVSGTPANSEDAASDSRASGRKATSPEITGSGGEGDSSSALSPPRVSLPPVTPDRVGGGPMPVGLRLPEVRAVDYRGSAALFKHVARISRSRYRLEPGSALPHDVSDELLGPPVTYPEQARTHAALMEGAEGLMVVEQEPSAAAEDLLIQAELAMRSGAHEDALPRYVEVNRIAPHIARAWFRRAEAELHLDDESAARTSLERGLSLSPIDPLGHALFAELWLREGDVEAARRSASRALALYPAYPPVVPLIPAIAGAPLGWRPFRPRVRVARRSDREILVQADAQKTEAWLAWALCQAASRFEADRSLLPFDDSSERLAIRRELLCAFSLADAATSPSAAVPGRPEVDPDVRRVAAIAEAGFLGEFTLYEIIGPRYPGILLHVSPEQHARLAAYIDLFVLPGREAAGAQ